jgi:hypothetical protein
MHANDVKEIVKNFIIEEILPDVVTHDYTKMDYETIFYRALERKILYNDKSLMKSWMKIHNRERHHCFTYTGSHKIHLGDVIHMCADWIAAGKGRSDDGKFVLDLNEFPPVRIKDLLYLAFKNTLEVMDLNTVVLD